jgi:hypothetical protein
MYEQSSQVVTFQGLALIVSGYGFVPAQLLFVVFFPRMDRTRRWSVGYNHFRLHALIYRIRYGLVDGMGDKQVSFRYRQVLQ